jgi:uncharacterized tellurite resistance protein B-like protein
VSILKWFTAISRTAPAVAGDSDTVARIVRELDQLEPDRARYLASFAYILSRVAGADLHVSEEETRHMVHVIERLGGLPEAQAVLVVEIAKKQNQLFGGTENYLVTRQFREIASDAQRQELLDCLFGVSAADDAITGEEEAQIWQIASELGFSHQDYVQARLAYSDKRTVLRREA